MRRLALAVLAASGCAAPEANLARETGFYRAALADREDAPGPASAKAAPAEESLARVAREWQATAARPEKLVRLADLFSPRARQIAEESRRGAFEGYLKNPREDELLAVAFARNPKIESARLAWRATLSRYEQAEAYDDVLRRYNAWTTRLMVPIGKPAGREGVGVSVPFPGLKGALGSLVTREAEIARDQYLQAANEALTEVKIALYHLAYLDRAITITAAHQRAIEAQANVAGARYRAGKGLYVDVLKAATEMAEVEVRLVTFRQERLAASVELNSTLARESQAAVGPVAEPALPELELKGKALETRVLSGSLEIALLRAKLQRMREMRAMSANEEYYKTLQRHYFFDSRAAPEAGPGRAGPEEKEAPRRMERDDAPAGMVTAYLQELSISIRSMEAEIAATEERTRHKVADHWVKFDDARRRSIAYRDSIVPKARQTLVASEAAYQGGQTDFISLTDTQRKVLSAQLEGIKAHWEALQAKVELEKLANSALGR